MIKSMTGYGRGVHRIGEIEVTAEIRSVNNRFLDVVLKIPRSLAAREQQVREKVSNEIRRGRINVWMSITGDEDKYKNLSINTGLLDAYMRIARQIEKESGVENNLDVRSVFTLPDIIIADNEQIADESTWQCAEVALDAALAEMSDMRQREGRLLLEDFQVRIASLDRLVQLVQEHAEDRPGETLEKMRSRLSRIAGYENIDEGRLELELAIIVDRMDVTEECVRFFSHNEIFRDMLNSEESQGRKLNFLLQEMNREANTMGSKANSAEISHLVVQVKEEIEKIREQVQNIE
ncbi:YicC family protein [candidate division KSB1 bacterium]|nr:YicC family protein [candidate division KSB1 bacterium]